MNIEDTMTFSIDKERAIYHFKKRRKKLMRLLIALVVWAIILVYLLTPFSSYKMMHVYGNVYMQEDEILELSGINRTWWWLVDVKKVKSELEKYDNIDNVSVNFNFNGLNISILEKYPLAIRNNKYLMNTTLELLNKDEYPYHVNNLVDISDIDDKYVNIFANQYIHVKLDVREKFYKASMEDEKILILEGYFDENSYFKMYLNLDYLSIKLSDDKFVKIKDEMLGKIDLDKLKYDMDNPCIVRYDLTNVYEYRIG